MVWMQLDWALGWKDSHTSLAHSYPQIVLLRKHMVMTHNASYNKQITSIICETGFLFHFGAIEKLLCHCSRPDSRCLCQPREHAANANTFSLRERQAELMIVLRPAPISHIKILSAGNKPWKVLVSIHWEITIISMQLCERFLMLCFCLVTFTVKNHTKKRGCIYEFFPFFKTCALSWKNGCIYRYAHFLTFKDNTRCILHIDVGQFTLVLALDIFYFSVVSCLIYKILKDISFVCCDNIVNFCLVKIFNLIFIF